MQVDGILLLYHHYNLKNASTIMEHVNAFGRHSRFKVWSVNTELGFPKHLGNLRFSIIVLHYSLCGIPPYHLDERFLEYLDNSKDSYKISFFQDEYHHCRRRFKFLDDHQVDHVFTLVEPAYFKDVYGAHTSVPNLSYTLTGYVSDDLPDISRRFAKPDGDRRLDIGYRGRRLPYHLGRGGQEKHEIGVRFLERAKDAGLVMDIATDEASRMYGDTWCSFMSDCRGMLGVEAGVTIFDLDDEARKSSEKLLAASPGIPFEEVWQQALHAWEGNIPYRTISPRHFEAAAFRSCQILFEGNYSGILQPMIHYLPLKKDFSNFDEIIRLFRDRRVRQEITDNAYRDLIASGRYTYAGFIADFDGILLKKGMTPEIGRADAAAADALLNRDRRRREALGKILSLRHHDFPGKKVIGFLTRGIRTRLGWRKTVQDI